jgi:hypothetical protein
VRPRARQAERPVAALDPARHIEDIAPAKRAGSPAITK